MTDAPDAPVVQLSDQQFQQLLGTYAGRNNEGGTAARGGKSVKPVRPTVDIDTSEGEWSIFEDQWARFKRMARLNDVEEIRDNLRQCCAT